MRALRFAWPALAALLGCPEEPARCGDGAVDPGEDEESCCTDTGCALGGCGAPFEEGVLVCYLPWEYDCRDRAGQCVEGTPQRCSEGAAPPSYDCAGCGCAAADACVDGVCYDAATRAFARDVDALPDDLDFSEYLALPLFLRSYDAFSLAEVARDLGGHPRPDPRLNTFILGWDERSQSWDPVVGAFLEASGTGELPRSDVDCVPGTGLWPEGAIVSVVAPDRASRATCAYPGMFIDCALPTNADCALGAGYLSRSVVFLDLDVVLDDADQAMLIRAGRAAPELRDAALVEALGVWRDASTAVSAQPGRAVGDRFAAVWPGDPQGTYWVLLRARADAALRLETYRAVWSDPPSQQFLIDHDIQTRACSFTLVGDGDDPPWLPSNVYLSCANAGATLNANVETAGFTLVDVTTTGG